MKKYLSLFRIRLINSVQYRAVTFGAVASNVVWVLLELMMYAALYKSAENALPMSFPQICSYVWVKRIVMNMLAVVAYDGEIYSVIHSGSVAYELVRPMDIYGKWYFQAAANRVTSTLVSCIPVLVIAMTLPEPYGLRPPMSALQALAFFVSVVLALGIVVAFAMLMFITLFYTIAQRGIKIIVAATTSFLSGGMIPLTFFPERILAILKYLPFSSMQSMPLLIYSGNITGTEILKGIAAQIIWMMILIVIGKVAMNYAIKHVVVQGG